MLSTHLKTIFSFRFYHQLAFATRWQLVWFGAYLFLLSVVVFHFFASSYIDNNLPLLLKNIPQVTFEKGVLSAPKNAVSAPIPGSDFKIVFDAGLKTPPTAAEMMKENTLMLVSGDKFYMPGSGGVQSQTIPPSFSFTTTPELLAKEQKTIAGTLGAVAFLSSLLAVPMVMLFGFCLAGAVGFFFSVISRKMVPRGIIFKWSFFMLGPLAALWYVRLWVNIPLFTLAQVILCLVYMQQIFNTLPEEK